MIINGAIKLGMYFHWLFTFSEDSNFQWNPQFTNKITILTKQLWHYFMPIFSAVYGEVYRQTVTVQSAFKSSKTGIPLKYTLQKIFYGEEKKSVWSLSGGMWTKATTWNTQV